MLAAVAQQGILKVGGDRRLPELMKEPLGGRQLSPFFSIQMLDGPVKTRAALFFRFQTTPIRKTHQETVGGFFVVEELFMPAVKRNREMVFPNLFDRYLESVLRHGKYSDSIFCYLIPGARVFFQFFDNFVEHTRFSPSIHAARATSARHGGIRPESD